MSLNALLHLWYAQHVLGTSMPIIRSSRLYVCYCRLWCAVLGSWLSGVRCRPAWCASRKRDAARCAASLFLDAQFSVLQGGFKPETYTATPDCLGRSLLTSQKTNFMFIKKNRQLRLYREIIAVCSQIHTKHINTAVWAERRIAEC